MDHKNSKETMITQRFAMLVYVGIILRKGNQILLMKRSQSIINGGLYAFPGGGVDGSETIAAATIRESYEELGITINTTDLKFAHAIHVKTDKNIEYIAFYYEATEWQGNPSIMEPDKCDELSWFDCDKLPSPMLATNEQALNMIKQNITLSEFGL